MQATPQEVRDYGAEWDFYEKVHIKKAEKAYSMVVETWRLHCIEVPMVVNKDGPEAGHVLLNVGLQQGAMGDIQTTPEALLCDWVANKTEAGSAVVNGTKLAELAEAAKELRL